MNERFVDLSGGRCCYRRRPADGPTCLLVHGATVGGWEFDRVANRLGDIGIGSVCPDPFGHGRSERPRERYDLSFFARQLDEFLDVLGLDRVVVVGHSLGAAVGARFALQRPDRVRGLVLAAPLYDFISLHPTSRLLGWPVLGRVVVESVIVSGLRRRRRSRYGGIEGGVYLERFHEQLAEPGFARALHRLFRDGALANQRPLYGALRAMDIPHDLLRGERDNVCPAAHVDAIQQLTRAPIREIEHAGHSMLLTHPDPVTRVISEFVERVGP